MTREEAIKVASEMYGWLKTDRERKALETLIPELSESEDERIRKIITDSVFYQYGAGDEYKDVLDYLDNLEKQKEQKEIPLMNGDADLYFDEWNQQNQNPTKRQCFEEGMLYAVRLLTEDSPMLEEFKKGLEQVILWGREGYKVSPDGTMKSLTQDEIDEVLDEQKEQKQEWSEEDEKILERFLGWLQGTMGEKTYSLWLKSLRERFNLQPKQEWSEEDRWHLDRIRMVLESWDRNHISLAGLPSTIPDDIDWLEKKLKGFYAQ